MFFNFAKDRYPFLIVIECHWRILRQTASIFSVSLQIITRFINVSLSCQRWEVEDSL